MQTYSGPILTIAHVRMAGRRLKIECQACGHSRHTAPWPIECKLKEKDDEVARVAERMRCRQCGASDPKIYVSQSQLEAWNDHIQLAHHQEKVRAAEQCDAFERETRSLELSYRRSGWLDRA